MAEPFYTLRPMTDNGRTTSVWMATAAMPEEPALGSDERADVCIVGAGIAGLTTAYLLAKADLVTPGEVDDVSSIRPGEGAILRRGAAKVAVHRDEAGRLHERSASCTHLGCIVQWNSMEKTWDCPCHGSRFHTDGHAVNGPATWPLKQ